MRGARLGVQPLFKKSTSRNNIFFEEIKKSKGHISIEMLVGKKPFLFLEHVKNEKRKGKKSKV